MNISGAVAKLREPRCSRIEGSAVRRNKAGYAPGPADWLPGSVPRSSSIDTLFRVGRTLWLLDYGKES